MYLLTRKNIVTITSGTFLIGLTVNMFIYLTSESAFIDLFEDNDERLIENVYRKSTQGDVKSEYSKVIIFDSSIHSGSLSFLDNPPSGWSVVVNNVQDNDQVDTCKQCMYVTQSWAESYVGIKWSDGLNESIKIKLATYMYILSLNSEWIYVTNKAQEIPYRALTRIVDNEFSTGLVYSGALDVFEPCHHFMDPITWYGKGKIGGPCRYSLSNVTRRSIYYVVDECFPSDVTEERWKLSLDQRAPIPYVMHGTFAILDFNNVLVSRETIWTLMATFPSVINQEISLSQQSLQLNLAVQRVLWETEHQIGFLPGVPQQKKCSVCHISSSIESFGKSFRDKLGNWTCDSTREFSSCVKELVELIIQDRDILSVIRLWIDHIHTYLENEVKKKTSKSERRPDNPSKRPLFFAPAKLLRKGPDNYIYPQTPLGNVCKKDGKPYQAFIPNSFQRPNVLLLVIINYYQFVSQIPLLEYIYGRYFNHIIYCSTQLEPFVDIYHKKNPNNPVSYITMPHAIHTHMCLTGAIAMNYDVVGYLQFSDDVLVNLWNFNNIPLNQPWFQTFIGVGQIRDRYFLPGNGGTSSYSTWNFFRKEMTNAWENLQKMKTDKIYGQRFSNFLERVADGTNCSTCIYFGNADIFYIPQRIARDFAFFAEWFDKFNVHFELTVINVIGGLVPKDDIYRLCGQYIWGSLRNKFGQLYNQFDHYYHAFKTSTLNSPGNAKFYCNMLVDNFDKHLRRMQ